MNRVSVVILMITEIGFPPVKWANRRIDQHRRQIELLRQAGCVESARLLPIRPNLACGRVPISAVSSAMVAAGPCFINGT